jgi:hypothetical protein
MKPSMISFDDLFLSNKEREFNEEVLEKIY